MLLSSFAALVLSTAAVIAAPASTYNPCTVLPSVGTERYGRTEFSAVNDFLFSNSLHIADDRGVLVSQTTALFNRDEQTWEERPGTGLMLSSAVTTRLDPLKLAITYHERDQEEQYIIYVETTKGETCVVPGSDQWTKVDHIVNAEEKGRPLLDCHWTMMKADERYSDPDTENTFEKDVEDNHFSSSNTMSNDPLHRTPALDVHLIPLVGAFIKQDPAYKKVTKLAIEYVDIKGHTRTSYAIANKTPLKLGQGDYNAALYNTGYCKAFGSKKWVTIKSVHFVV